MVLEMETLTVAAGSASKRAKSAVAAIGAPSHDPKKDELAVLREGFTASADMASKLGTVPLVIPMSAIHLINPVAPSTQKQNQSGVIRRKAPQYSGTMTYTPPEPMRPVQLAKCF